MASGGKLAFKPRLKAPERRVSIEAAAAELFAHRGYDASLDEIARAAGVTKRVIYDHFASKQALHVALLRRQSEELLAVVDRAATIDAPPRERVVAGAEAFFAFVEEHPFAWRMLFRDPAADPKIAAVHHELQGRATVAIAQLLASDEAVHLRIDDRGDLWQQMIAAQVKAALNGLAAWWYEHRDVSRAEVVDAAIDLIWSGLSEHTR